MTTGRAGRVALALALGLAGTASAQAPASTQALPQAAAAPQAAASAQAIPSPPAPAVAGPRAASPALAVTVPSLDQVGGQAVALPAEWFAAPLAAGAAAAPAIVLLHGCGGAHAVRRDGSRHLGERYTELAAALNALGIHVLVTDSLTPRGERSLCAQPIGGRRVTQLHRRRDALGALAWLAAQPGVDAARLGVIGWSHGGSAVLASTNLVHPEVRRAPRQPSLAVAFYPGCGAEAARGYRPAAPLLMLLGEADDWTPAAPCKALAAAARAEPPVPTPEVAAYEGAYHGFDGTAPVRHWRHIPNGVNPGQGVHVGGHPAARAAARERLVDFLRRTWALPA